MTDTGSQASPPAPTVASLPSVHPYRPGDAGSGFDALASLVDAVYPEHAASAHEPGLVDDAHPAVRALWSRLGQSSSLAPRGLTRDADEPEVHASSTSGRERRPGGSPTPSCRRARAGCSRESWIDFIDDASPDADPPVLEQHAMFFYGSALDDRRRPVPGLSSLARKYIDLGGCGDWGPLVVSVE